MSTMNISLPESLKAFVDDQVSQRGYGTSSEYLRELIRKDQIAFISAPFCWRARLRHLQRQLMRRISQDCVIAFSNTQKGEVQTGHPA